MIFLVLWATPNFDFLELGNKVNFFAYVGECDPFNFIFTVFVLYFFGFSLFWFVLYV
jgi:hypothetical protein